MPANPYDELPYRSLPIEWTAPERLALASLLHGGPRPRLDGYRVLELGCGDGANLLPLAYYRSNASFVGVDGARSRIEVAERHRSMLGLSNVELVGANFREAADRLTGEFDFIVAHGVFSWVPPEDRDALLALCAARLRRGGLLYLNYNAYPGWKVRGMVREFLLAETASRGGLRTRAELAQDVAARVVATLSRSDHAYSRLIADEFRFVCESDASYVAHEFLAADNRAYWRSEFLALAERHGLAYVADADFNYGSGRIPEELAPHLVAERIGCRAVEDTIDLLCYRQLHSPIFTNAPLAPVVPSVEEFAGLFVASCLTPCDAGGEHPTFQHPSGFVVEAKTEGMRSALVRLRRDWPRGLCVGTLFPDVSQVIDDLRLLHRNGVVELRCVEPRQCPACLTRLNELERRYRGHVTTPYHTRIAPDIASDGPSGTAEEGVGLAARHWSEHVVVA
jgi:cyclopropane fatty-acyl-phospholipid synthase-like methyltransferase